MKSYLLHLLFSFFFAAQALCGPKPGRACYRTLGTVSGAVFLTFSAIAFNSLVPKSNKEADLVEYLLQVEYLINNLEKYKVTNYEEKKDSWVRLIGPRGDSFSMLKHNYKRLIHAPIQDDRVYLKKIIEKTQLKTMSSFSKRQRFYFRRYLVTDDSGTKYLEIDIEQRVDLDDERREVHESTFFYIDQIWHPS